MTSCGTAPVLPASALSTRRSTLWGPTNCALLTISIVAGFCVSNAVVEAQPVTYKFDAAITSVASGVPFDSGITFAVGDMISGRFTFEPNTGVGGMNLDTVQPYAFVLEVDGTNLFSPTFEIRAVNNGSLDDVPGVSEIDSLVVGAGGLSSMNPAVGINPATSGFRMTLFGPATAFGGASIPGDIDVWNSFDIWRDISVTFRNANGGAVGFQATVGSFQLVPEPTTLFYISFITILFLIRPTR